MATAKSGGLFFGTRPSVQSRRGNAAVESPRFSSWASSFPNFPLLLLHWLLPRQRECFATSGQCSVLRKTSSPVN